MLLKSESVQLKGVAIMTMVFLHLFNRAENVDLCINSVYLFNIPLTSQLAKFAEICVPLYLFLSGYGLYILYLKNNNISPSRRIFKLYLNFWTVFIIFIPLGCFLKPDQYPGNLLNIVENVTAWRTSYNWEWWFIFPYIILLSFANVLFKCIRQYGFWSIVVSSSMIYVVSYLCISFYESYLLENYLIFIILESFEMVCSFVWGALFVKYDIFGKIERTFNFKSNYATVIGILIIIGLILVRSIIPIHAARILFMIAFVCSYMLLKRNTMINVFLMNIGEKSTAIWLIHTFFCYYFFHDFIYGFKYPIVIFVVTFLLSYVSALFIDNLYQRMWNKLSKYF